MFNKKRMEDMQIQINKLQDEVTKNQEFYKSKNKIDWKHFNKSKENVAKEIHLLKYPNGEIVFFNDFIVSLGIWKYENKLYPNMRFKNGMRDLKVENNMLNVTDDDKIVKYYIDKNNKKLVKVSVTDLNIKINKEVSDEN